METNRDNEDSIQRARRLSDGLESLLNLSFLIRFDIHSPPKVAEYLDMLDRVLLKMRKDLECE
jgi:hypothetical protein